MNPAVINLDTITISPVFEINAGEVIQQGIPNASPKAVKQVAWLQPSYAEPLS